MKGKISCRKETKQDPQVVHKAHVMAEAVVKALLGVKAQVRKQGAKRAVNDVLDIHFPDGLVNDFKPIREMERI